MEFQMEAEKEIWKLEGKRRGNSNNEKEKKKTKRKN